jgi:hypothetical protein
LIEEIQTMSDFDGGDYNHGQVETGHQDYDLDHGHQAYANEHDASQNYDAYAQAHNYENDQHYANGHHVEYDNPHGEHYEESDYTNADSHVAESDAAYGEHYDATEHNASSAELDYLREHFDAEFAHADYADKGYEGGQQELSAVNK